MGVPVLSLYGHTMPSMAHAVLCGVGLNDWAQTQKILDFAESLSREERLMWLRNNRHAYRELNLLWLVCNI